MLRVAGELPHPVVQVVGHGDAGNDAGELDSGGRSLDGVGFDATVQGEGACGGYGLLVLR